MTFDGTFLAEFEKSQGQIIKIHRVSYMGKDNIDFRLFLMPENQHTVKGITFPMDKLPDLIIAVNEAAEKAHRKK